MEGAQEKTPPSKKAVQQAGLKKYGETTLAFENMIIQVGRAIARAQQSMDFSAAEFQKQVRKAIEEGRIQKMEIMPVNAYTMPETSLEIKTSLSIHYPEGGGEPQISAQPLNAENATGEAALDAATNIKLKYINIPETRDTTRHRPPAVDNAMLQKIVETHWLNRFSRKNIAAYRGAYFYLEKERIRIGVDMAGGEPAFVMTVDDRTGEVMEAMFKPMVPTPKQIESVGLPTISGVTPKAAKSGDFVTVHGDNFAAIGGQTQILIDGKPTPVTRLAMRSLTFKTPGWALRGDVEILTPLGSTGERGRSLFTPLPTLFGVQPKTGFYDSVRKKGSKVVVSGANLHSGAKYYFSPAGEAVNVNVLSPFSIQLEVPPNSGTGPLYCRHNDHIDFSEEVFVKVPYISRVSPRQGCIGDTVSIIGNSFLEAFGVGLRGAMAPRSDFLFHSDREIRFKVPPGTFDGRVDVILEASSLGSDKREVAATSSDIFYVVPRITGFQEGVACRGQVITVFGEGLDPDPDMMTLLFESERGIVEASLIEVSSDRASFTCRVPVDAVSGYVMLIRKKIFSGLNAADTSYTADNKITILNMAGDPGDVILEERFSGDLSPYRVEAGEWFIKEGMLTGFGRLGLSVTPGAAFDIYADLLGAKCFGYSLELADKSKIQLWVDLTLPTPELTWSRIDPSGIRSLVGGSYLSYAKNGNFLFQLIYEEETLRCLLNQSEASAIQVGPLQIGGVSILAKEMATNPLGSQATLEPLQMWDNVVMLTATHVLALAPPELYRFGEAPQPPTFAALFVEGFSPKKGGAGTVVKISGAGFDADTRFYFGEAEALVSAVTPVSAEVVVPEEGKSGPILAAGRGGVMATSSESFLLPPKITHLIPERVIAGERLLITGENLPLYAEDAQIQILGKVAQILSASSTSLAVAAPAFAGKEKVTIVYAGFVTESSVRLEVVLQDLIFDLIESAQDASWASSLGAAEFGELQGESGAGATRRSVVRLEDGGSYEGVLVLSPPAPLYGKLRGLFPIIDVPMGRVELRLVFGTLEEEISVDEPLSDRSCAVEIHFIEAGHPEPHSVLEKTSCYYDDSLEFYFVDLTAISGKRGRFELTVSASQTPSEIGFLRAQLFQLA